MDIHIQIMKHNSYTLQKINSIIGLNTKKNLKLLENNTRENLHDLGMAMTFWV